MINSIVYSAWVSEISHWDEFVSRDFDKPLSVKLWMQNQTVIISDVELCSLFCLEFSLWIQWKFGSGFWLVPVCLQNLDRNMPVPSTAYIPMELVHFYLCPTILRKGVILMDETAAAIGTLHFVSHSLNAALWQSMWMSNQTSSWWPSRIYRMQAPSNPTCQNPDNVHRALCRCPVENLKWDMRAIFFIYQHGVDGKWNLHFALWNINCLCLHLLH